MKILHIPFGYYPDPIGGTEVYVTKLAQTQQQLGLHPIIAAPGTEAITYRYAGLIIHRFPVASLVADLRELYGAGDPLAAKAFAQLLDNEQPDLVHLHAFTRGVSLMMLRTTRERGIPVVFTYHTPTVSCLRGTLLRWGQAVCDGLLAQQPCAACSLHSHGLPRAVSQLVAGLPPMVGSLVQRSGRTGRIWTALRASELVDLRRRTLHALLSEVDALVALCDWTRVLLVGNGVPTAKITLSRHGLARIPELPPRPPRTHGAPLRIAFLGRFDPTKGPDLLISAVRSLPETPLQLDLYGIVQAGNEQYASQLQAAASSDQRIRILPPVPHNQVIPVLAGYDLLAVPSRCLETGPLVVLEAFAARTPVLGSNMGGIAELVRHERDGLLVAPDDLADWAFQIKQLATKPELVRQLQAGIQPPRLIRDVANDMLKLYAQLIRS